MRPAPATLMIGAIVVAAGCISGAEAQQSGTTGTTGTANGDGLVRVLYKNGDLTASDEQVWARPVGIAVAKDGSLIVAEDGSGTIWRVSYRASGSVRP